jgi:hypothetical protein
VADLEFLDVSASSRPTLVAAGILDPKNFQLASSHDRVIYARLGVVGDDGEELEPAGIFSRTLP